MTSQDLKPTAFTLIEVLLGMVLSIALLSGLWASLNLYTKIFSSGHAEVEQAQLIQGLLSKLSVELRAAVPPPKQEEIALTNSGDNQISQQGSTSFESSGCCGLRGDAHWIEIDLVLPLLETAQNQETDATTASSMSTTSVPELATVRYYIAEADLVTPITDGVSTGEAAGLVRIARPWGGQPGAEEAASASAIDFESPSGYSSMADPFVEEGNAASDLFINSENRHAPQLLASEVTQLEFRYFNGQFWDSQWDSRAMGSLPLAVEVAVAIPRKPPTATSTTSGDVATEDSFSSNAATDMRGASLFENSDTSFRSNVEQLPWVISRRLVALPLGTKPPEIGSSSTSDDDSSPMEDPLPEGESTETEDASEEVAP